jgi:hypothetical protein
MYVSVDGKAKKVKEIFAGGADGLAHKINEVFGSVDGVAKLVYSGEPKELNSFDSIPWDEIKAIADEGALLDFFNKGDKVNIKLKTPLESTINGTTFYQDILTMSIVELSATGMKLVSTTAVPGRFIFRYDNATYVSDFESSTSYKSSTPSDAWGMCSELYRNIKKVDDALPDDFREVLTNFAPLTTYEYYYDSENKRRLRKEYGDCRVRQISECYYDWHQEYVEERERNEYILDFTPFERKEGLFKKYIPQELRANYDSCYTPIKATYKKTDDSWLYTLGFNRPSVSWKWDWENYNGVNSTYMIANPEYTTYSPDISIVIPEVQIGTL